MLIKYVGDISHGPFRRKSPRTAKITIIMGIPKTVLFGFRDTFLRVIETLQTIIYFYGPLILFFSHSSVL